jgi:Spy/CpxP family protein refolding chaperone
LAAAVKEEVEKARAVLTAEQKEKLAATKDERRERRSEGLAERIAHLEELDLTTEEMNKIVEIRKEFRPRLEKVLKELHGLLTPEQREAREEGLKAGKKRREIVASLKLTDEQKEKVQNVCKEVGTVVREEMEQIRDILTASQKEKIQEFREERRERVRDRHAHRIANLKELNLTEEQRTKITDIRKEYAPRVHEAGNKLRATVREEIEQIVAVLKQG